MDRALVKGWCPGALRPMESGDGLIARLKPTGGIVPLPLAMRIADWSRRWGNGQIDLTSRANLQLRGLSPDGVPALQDALLAEGLLDPSPEGEAVRNVVASPAAGIDPEAVLDIRPLTAALEHRLAGDVALHALPGKFGFAIDDGGRFGLDDVTADVRFVAVRTVDGPVFVVGLDGDNRAWLGPCAPDALVDVAARLARVFIDGSGPVVRRMRDLVAVMGAEAVGRICGLGVTSGPAVRTASPPPNPPPSRGRASDHVPPPGWGRLGGGGGSVCPKAVHSGFHWDDRKRGIVGVGLPFGRISAEDLAELADRARAHGAHELRLTPWRALLIPLASTQAADSFLAALRRIDSFIFDDADPRRYIAACVGAPACARATTDVRSDATRLASLVATAVDRRIALHVSGCPKGCAHRGAAPVTLIGRDGLYDLVRDGTPADMPARRGLTLDQAVALLRGEESTA